MAVRPVARVCNIHVEPIFTRIRCIPESAIASDDAWFSSNRQIEIDGKCSLNCWWANDIRHFVDWLYSRVTLATEGHRKAFIASICAKSDCICIVLIEFRLTVVDLDRQRKPDKLARCKSAANFSPANGQNLIADIYGHLPRGIFIISKVFT